MREYLDTASTTQPKVEMKQGDTAPIDPGAAVEEWHQLTSEIVFQKLWERPGLAPRDRSIATLAVMFGQQRPPGGIRFHISRGRENGLEFEEIHELAVHTAFYAGWPTGSPAVELVNELWTAELAVHDAEPSRGEGATT